jgi:ATP-dependent DNA helicase RecG
MLQALLDSLEELRPLQETPQVEQISERINDRISERINDTELAVYSIVKENPYATYEEIASSTGRSYSSVQRAIQGLKNKGYIVREGSNKSGVWRVVKEA